ncbi:MAG: hypothetical protein GXP08_17415 [Gammaproteobacteria bacterium]|nr:hypothetical protein [Gammaproteobacteria bacterium]
MLKKPIWLDEQPAILILLHSFLDKLDATKPAQQRRNRPSIAVNRETIPSLFTVDESADQLWVLLCSLSTNNSGDFPLFDIVPNKKRHPLDPEYDNAKLRLNLESEPILRQWLKRPQQVASRILWQQAIDENAHRFEGDIKRLRGRELKFIGKSPQDVITAFLNIHQYLDKPVTLRQLSAFCFWGNSKFLDGREDLVRTLHPQLQLSSRPILVNVYLPAKVSSVLFIENQDNYSHAMSCRSEGIQQTALVYCAGFQGSARRIRSIGGVSLHYSTQSPAEVIHCFENWWFDTPSFNWPEYFWGDLDFSAMSILKMLRQRFVKMQAWQPGYTPMLQQLRNNEGHLKNTGNALIQLDPGQTGCQYADEVLLPAIRMQRHFVDQEVVVL